MQSDLGTKRLLLAGTTLGFVVVQLDVTIVNVALQEIGTSLGSSVASLQWIVNAYTLVFAALILTTGALGDRLGARRVFLAGFAIFGASSLACGLSTSMAMLIAARTVQGFGAAILVPCSLALINHNFLTDAERNRAVAVWAAGASLAVAAGPVIGGVLIATIGWRSIFFVNVPIALIGIWLVWRYSQETSRLRGRGLDVAGQLLAIFALADLAATMIEQRGVAGFALFATAAVAFTLVESRSQSPMLPLGVFENPTFSITTIVGWIINVAFLLSTHAQIQRAENRTGVPADDGRHHARQSHLGSSRDPRRSASADADWPAHDARRLCRTARHPPGHQLLAYRWTAGPPRRGHCPHRTGNDLGGCAQCLAPSGQRRPLGRHLSGEQCAQRTVASITQTWLC